MKAAWDWHVPRETPTEQRDLVEFAAECGFDTLIVRDPTQAMSEAGDAYGITIIGIVDARPDETFAESHPECLQQTHSVETAILDAIDAHGPDGIEYRELAHRWYPPVQGADFLCFEHEIALEYLETQVSETLAVADGVAFDGFGFKNHYACFCDRCVERREQRLSEEEEEGEEWEGENKDHKLTGLHAHSEETLIETSRRLYDHATEEDSSTIVTNHVWPPFDPNPTYGHRLHLDYCTQTVSWFYRPTWSLERVEFEAARHARLASETETNTNTNTFVPFIGLFDDPYHKRSPERVRSELEIGLEYGDGNVVLCTLGLPYEDRSVKAAVRDALE